MSPPPAIHITFVDVHGKATTAQGRTGRSLMRTAMDAGIDGIAADCGGCLTCATCHVYVDEAWLERLAAASGEESEMLGMTAAERRPSSRLSCQIELSAALHGLVVHLPGSQY